MLALKLLLSPILVVCASLIARRFGERVGGVISGLPSVGGPILLLIAIDQGPSFAADAAASALLGFVALSVYAVSYARIAPYAHWAGCIAIAWPAFIVTGGALGTLDLSLGVSLALAVMALAAARALMPEPGPVPPVPRAPRWDLPVRAVAAAALVLAVGAVAGWLGPSISGVLAPFPVLVSIMVVSTHAQQGSAAAQRILRGLLIGVVAFVLFALTLALGLEPLGVAWAFGVAFGVAVLSQALMLLASARRARIVEPAALSTTRR